MFQVDGGVMCSYDPYVFQACVGVIVGPKHVVTTATCVSSHPMNR